MASCVVDGCCLVYESGGAELQLFDVRTDLRHWKSHCHATLFQGTHASSRRRGGISLFSTHAARLYPCLLCALSSPTKQAKKRFERRVSGALASATQPASRPSSGEHHHFSDYLCPIDHAASRTSSRGTPGVLMLHLFRRASSAASLCTSAEATNSASRVLTLSPEVLKSIWELFLSARDASALARLVSQITHAALSTWILDPLSSPQGQHHNRRT